ncbi:glutaredoxin 3 [Microvirga sp. W0021]|uniref:Glutaredoxin n=1 Tax=Hohaiivirga grylli TaxID=3133970 RepID=A0ABV0BL54_9HYPH
MPKIIIYAKSWCPYCKSAKQLLEQKGATFTEIDVEKEAGALDDMLAKSGGRKTVPQIFINDQHIGGFDDLYAFDQSGKLDPLLKE